jgi:hypothetical protein
MTIKEFLESLASNSSLLEEYQQDPEGVAQREGMTAKQIRVLTSHDVLRIRHAIELESGDVTGQLVWIVM